MDRGTRRARTARIANRRLKLRRRTTNPLSPFRPKEFWTPRVERWDTAGYYAKHTALGCRCSKRKAGQPRRNRGMCGMEERDRHYAGRANGRALRILARTGWADWDADRVALLEGEPL